MTWIQPKSQSARMSPSFTTRCGIVALGVTPFHPNKPCGIVSLDPPTLAPTVPSVLVTLSCTHAHIQSDRRQREAGLWLWGVRSHGHLAATEPHIPVIGRVGLGLGLWLVMGARVTQQACLQATHSLVHTALSRSFWSSLWRDPSWQQKSSGAWVLWMDGGRAQVQDGSDR